MKGEGIKKKRKLKKNVKIILYLILFLSFVILGVNLILNSFNIQDEKSINYKEQSNLDYKVFLKKNDFYENDYLGKDMLYIANLIDNIKINLNYNFDIDENSNIDFVYDVIGKIVIADETGKNSYFEKSYVLQKEKTLKMTDNNHFNINDNIDIDYNYYNNLANDFKMSYGLNPSSNLIVYFRISKKDSNNSENVILNSSSLMSVTIPLSEKSVNIKMDYKDIDETSKLISKSDILLENIISFVIGIVLIVVSLVFMIKFMRLLNLSGKKKSVYEKYINKLLREYDRLIVETSTGPIIDNKEIINIDKFEELLDVRDNLKLPIMHYTIEENEECYFYINYENSIYLNIINKDKFEESKKKEK